MANLIVIMGDSGAGKTYSIKSLDPAQVSVISCKKNRLPFAGNYTVRKVVDTVDQNGQSVFAYDQIKTLLRSSQKKIFVIDDSTFLLKNEQQRNTGLKIKNDKVNGFMQYEVLSFHFKDLIDFILDEIPEDIFVILMHHITKDETGKVKTEVVGKSLDSLIEKSCDVVLLAEVENGEHYFLTESCSYATTKSPEGMFPPRIANSLKTVIEGYKKYYGME